jgi:serine/threonine protein kinase
VTAVLAGKYRLERKLGEGGFGVTYFGLETNLDLAVAVKAIRTQECGKVLEEARRLARFRSLPGIVPVIDYFTENGTAYIAKLLKSTSNSKARLNGTKR